VTTIESLKKQLMKTVKWKLIGSIAVSALLIVGCSSPVHIQKDDSVDLSRYKTFAWADRGSKDKERNRKNELMEQKFKEAVTKELTREGWRVDNRHPDALISYDVLVERGRRSQSDPVYSRPFIRTFYNPYARRFFSVYYPSQFIGYDDYETSIREGTVTITMTDANTNKEIWQAWTTNEVNSHNLTNKEINSAVKSIFRKFDVAKR
jgi:hypothetical protein